MGPCLFLFWGPSAAQGRPRDHGGWLGLQYRSIMRSLSRVETAAKVSLTCHSEGAERPKNLISKRKCEILRFAQDDKRVLG